MSLDMSENILLLFKTYHTVKSVMRWLCSPCASAFYLAKIQAPLGQIVGGSSFQGMPLGPIKVAR